MSTPYPKFYSDRLLFLRLNITHYRKRKGWTQQQLAEAADISTGYLASLEAKQSTAVPSFDMICLLAYHLEVEPSDLMAADAELVE